MKKAILLILPALLFAGCSVKNKEIEITVFHNPVPSVYTGKVKRKIPEGKGAALMDNEAKVEGIFEAGTFISGEAERVPYGLKENDQSISGIYTGEVSDQLPSGNGVFESDAYSYEGTWLGGVPDGTGVVTAEYFCIDTPSEVLEGSYSGDVSGGKAEGTGTFTYLQGNDQIEMKGTFSDNRFDGLLVKTIQYQDTVKAYPVYYENGELVQNAAATIAYLEGMRNESYCLSEAEITFISDHSALFEGNGTNADMTGNSSIFDYAAFNEDSDPSLTIIRNAVIKSVERYKPYTGSDIVTSMIVQNSDGWYHLVFAYSVKDVSAGDTVNISALPLCRSTLTAPEQDYEAIDAAGAAIIGN